MSQRLIDYTFFVGEINIPNSSKAEVKSKLNLFIDKYEKELLQQLLGYPLWKLYDADPTPQRFQDLINGVDYDNSHWRGLVYMSGENKFSMIAYYIYYWWMKDQQIWNSGVGTLRPKGDTSEIMPIYLKQMEAWNTFSTQVGELVDYMNNSETSSYPEWIPVNLWQFAYINDFDI